MGLTFRPVRPKEMDILCDLDTTIFGEEDGFTTPDLWEGLEIYFIVTDKIIGSIAFRHHSDVSESYEAKYPYLNNSLYLVSIGILPEKQAKGTGSKAMTWLLDYACGYGFSRIVSNARKSNLPSLRLHLKAGFKITHTIPGYYEKPDEDATIFELKL